MAFWSLVESEDSLHELLESSVVKPVLILKHSYRCALSSMAKSRIEKNEDSRLEYHLIDVVKDREISNRLSDLFSVSHESPQAFLVKDSKLIEVKSHLAIKPHGFSVLLDSFAGQ
ncbi:bacillithiol system redox-active protein YtxJ [Cryomorphaceae bacterium 1068]|nr:bacillithiol system redox-active protein YtxJ [Cryomorphaceae bacterium 1068]